MADVFVYADETGNLDYNPAGKEGASTYFGFGSVIFNGDHSDALWQGLVLRAALEQAGHPLPKGFHAKNDRWEIRSPKFALLSSLGPRVDATFLRKAGAYDYVKARGWEYLYKYAWYAHLKYLCEFHLGKDDHLYVVVASLGTKKRQQLAREAIQDVCDQMPQSITLCIWDAATSWGLQAADYALWAVQREVEKRPIKVYDSQIKPLVESCYFPWGKV